MRVHPYRTLSEVAESSAGDGFEERAVGFVLALAGLLGIAIGASAPNANATELVLGIALLGIGLRTWARSPSEPVV